MFYIRDKEGNGNQFIFAVTHGGKFHADDVMSAALLQLIHANWLSTPVTFSQIPDFHFDMPEGNEADTQIQAFFYHSSTMERSNNICIPIVRFTGTHEECNEKFGDTTLKFDIGYGKYDHHQGTEPRVDGIPYAALGKLWRDYGPCFFVGDIAASAADYFDKHYIEPLDLHDTTGAYNEIADFIESMNGAGEDLSNPQYQNERFVEAMTFAMKYLHNRIEKVQKTFTEVERIRQCDGFTFTDAKDRVYECVICDWRVEPEDIEIALPGCDVVIYPHDRGGFAVRGLVNPHGQWLNDEKLLEPEYALSAGCRFIHPNRFIACFNKLEEAKLAVKNTDRREDPRAGHIKK